MGGIGGFGVPIQLNLERKQRDAQEKQARSDQEFQGKAAQYAGQLSDLRNKLALAPEGSAQYNETMNALQGTVQQLRELYHPDKNPGAIAKFGHLLTDALHITNPQQRIQADAAKKTAAIAGDEREAQQIAATRPQSPDEIAAQQTKAEIDRQNATANARIDWLKKNGAPPDVIQRAIALAGGVTSSKAVPLPGAKPYKGPDGRYRIPVRDPDTNQIVEELMPSDYVAPPDKPSTSKFGVNIASYKALHGIPENQPLTTSQLNFVEQQIAFASAAPSTTITNTLKQDYRGFFVPVQETNRRIPGFGAILRDPLGEVPLTDEEKQQQAGAASAPASPASPAAATPPPSATHRPAAAAGKKPTVPKTPKEAKQAAQSGGVKVGNELFAGPSKEYADTQSAYDAALHRTSTMDKNLQNALRGDQQAMLSLVANHIGMTLGAQKGARINQAVWNEAVASAPWLESVYAKSFHNDPDTGEMVFDGWKSGVTLTDDQMHQMVDLAHEQVDTLKQDLDRITQRLTAPQGTNTPPAAPPPAAVDPKVKSLADRLSDSMGGP